MKKIIALSILLLSFSAHAKNYTCSSFDLKKNGENGNPDKVTVSLENDSKIVATLGGKDVTLTSTATYLYLEIESEKSGEVIVAMSENSDYVSLIFRTDEKIQKMVSCFPEGIRF